MEEANVLNYKYRKGVREVFPANRMISNWLFDEETEKQAILANSMADVAELNGLTANDLQHLFPAVLRMLKDKTQWSK
jgi:hypothetical protein